MQNLDLVIKNGTVATAADVITCDIGISGGRIVALAEDLHGDKVIDATGKIVMPGGVDSHLHLDQPTGDGSVMADDFLTGTISAACGGTTTVIPFACQQKGNTIKHAVDDYHARAEGKAVIDYTFHLIITDTTEQVLSQELPEFIKNGYTSFKIYMTYDALKLNDHQILDILSVARRDGAMAMIHAENADCIAWLTEKLEQAGDTAPHFHAASRPPVVEREATHRAISLAELVDVPVLIVHVSGPEAIEQIRWAQNRGFRVYAETCPQYLFLTAEDLQQDGFEGAKCICSPPPRDKSSQQDVWRGIENGTFQVFSSDHAPFRYEDDKGKKMHGEDTPFKYIPTVFPVSKRACHCYFQKASARAGSICAGLSNCRQPMPPEFMDSTREREPLRLVPMPTLQSGIRIRKSRSPIVFFTTTSTTRPMKVCKCAAGQRPFCHGVKSSPRMAIFAVKRAVGNFSSVKVRNLRGRKTQGYEPEQESI